LAPTSAGVAPGISHVVGVPCVSTAQRPARVAPRSNVVRRGSSTNTPSDALAVTSVQKGIEA
jgi:hypothetical protein